MGISGELEGAAARAATSRERKSPATDHLKMASEQRVGEWLGLHGHFKSTRARTSERFSGGRTSLLRALRVMLWMS